MDMHNSPSTSQANTEQYSDTRIQPGTESQGVAVQNRSPNTIELYFDHYRQKLALICAACSKVTLEGETACCSSLLHMWNRYFSNNLSDDIPPAW